MRWVRAGRDGADGAGYDILHHQRWTGKGGDLGGLAGADAHCQALAAAAGAGNKTWRAYLSTDSVNAHDRVGNGPWQNAKGVVIAADLAELHSPANRISKAIGLDEKGQPGQRAGATTPTDTTS